MSQATPSFRDLLARNLWLTAYLMLFALIIGAMALVVLNARQYDVVPGAGHDIVSTTPVR